MMGVEAVQDARLSIRGLIELGGVATQEERLSCPQKMSDDDAPKELHWHFLTKETKNRDQLSTPVYRGSPLTVHYGDFPERPERRTSSRRF
jgi:hypothetical protein